MRTGLRRVFGVRLTRAVSNSDYNSERAAL
jgi:hypothetical protein